MKTKNLWLIVVWMAIMLAGPLACRNASEEKTVSKTIPAEKLIKEIRQRNVVKVNGFPQAFENMMEMDCGVVYADKKDTIFLIDSYPESKTFRDNHFQCWYMFKDIINEEDYWWIRQMPPNFNSFIKETYSKGKFQGYCNRRIIPSASDGILF